MSAFPRAPKAKNFFLTLALPLTASLFPFGFLVDGFDLALSVPPQPVELYLQLFFVLDQDLRFRDLSGVDLADFCDFVPLI